MPKPLHFIYSGTQNFLGGGITAWKSLLTGLDLPNPIYLHYSSYAQETWRDFQFPYLTHIVHDGWKTWDNRNHRHYDNSHQDFRFDTIPSNAKVVFDSIECVKQLTLPIAKKGCEIYWRVNSPEHCLRKDPVRMIKDLYRIQHIKKLIFISEYVERVFKTDIVYRLFSKKLPSAVVKNGTHVDHDPIAAQHEYVVYFGRFDYYKHPLFLEKLTAEVRYVGTTKCCSKPQAIPPAKNLGWMKPTEAAQYGDIFVFPAIGEAFGFAVIEMMSYGKIPICFRSGAFPEIVDHEVNGYLVKPFDYRAVNRIVTAIQSDQALKAKLRKNAIEKAKQFDVTLFRKNFIKEILI